MINPGDVVSGLEPNAPADAGAHRSISVDIYGIKTFGALFNDRQLLAMQSFVESLHKGMEQITRDENDSGYRQAVLTYLGLWVSRIAQRSSNVGVWHVSRETLEHPFGRQAIPMTWDYPEANPFSEATGGAASGLDWIARVIEHEAKGKNSVILPAEVKRGDGAHIPLKTGLVTAVVTDPPYFDSVAYADLSDFFYIWLKRGLSDVLPEAFSTPQTPKTEEAVAHKHRHHGKRQKGKEHFERKLTECFAEAKRLCKTDGVIAVMFAHQSTEAWTALVNALFKAGLNITATYPIDTELTTALKGDIAALETSITVICRPRRVGAAASFKDVRREIEKAVRESVHRFWNYGFRGADLIVACYGPAVGVFGQHERVERLDGTPVSVPDLLELCRELALKAIAGEFEGDELSRLYFVWANQYGIAPQSYDDLVKVAQMGTDTENAADLAHQRGLFVADGPTCRLALLRDRIEKKRFGEEPDAPLIDLAQGAAFLVMLDWRTVFGKLWDGPERRRQLFTATVPSGLNQVDLRWVRGFEGDLSNPANYRLERRLLGETTWDNKTIASNVRSDNYSDTGVSAGTLYEYRVPRLAGADSPTVVAALRAGPVHSRGTALLLVDGTLAGDVATEVSQFVADLQGDGWRVSQNQAMPRHCDFDTAKGYTEAGYKTEVSNVKQQVANIYNNATWPKPLVLILIGHVTIPYSGSGAEDGHCMEHDGAWPADVYYGDTDGVWTDNGTSGLPRQPLINVPNDRKWDQTSFPANASGKRELEVAVGRIDFANMPAFIQATYLPTPHTTTAEVERALIRHYFNKVHRYRTKQFAVTAGDTWRLFILDTPFFSLQDTARSAASRLAGGLAEEYRPLDDVFATAAQYNGHIFLWGIHGGYGQPSRVLRRFQDGWRSSLELTVPANEPQVIFYLLSGSWFVDWNWMSWPWATDGFMRACLSTPNYGLAASWALDGVAGPWKMERLALGYHLGTMLQDTISAQSQSCRTVYILGDPTLRCYVVAPPSNLSGSVQGNQVSLTWTAAPETVDGYYVYRGGNLEGALQSGPLNSSLITTTHYTDQNVPSGSYIYAVRASSLVLTGAGSFRNLSQSIKTQVDVGQ